MSHDGSSAKSYIRHPTEKERLDNLAFASFPEDYLPYAAAPGHHRVAAPPPYLLWGEDRRRKPTKRSRNPRCAGALLCAIALVVVAILAVVAISVYLGVVTNLFRSPVVSVSGRFMSPEDFSEELLNSTSSQFLEKADIFQAKVEKAFLSSSLEPAFIAARIYAFRPGLVVFFRVYLDRRKIRKDDGDSPPTELVRELVSQKLAVDPDSVHVEESDELLSADGPPIDILPVVTAPSKPTAEQPSNPPPSHSGGVGLWRPVPIEDSVSPSFADRPQGGIGSVRSPEESSRRNPVENIAPVRVREESPPRNPQLTGTPLEGVGSVRVLEDSPPKNPLLPVNRREGTGTVRFLEEPPPPKVPNLNGNLPEGFGSVRVIDENPQRITKLPGNTADGVGSVRIIDETPKRNGPSTGVSRAGIGLVRVLEETPKRRPSDNSKVAEGVVDVRVKEEPPTLAPFVSLVIRNRSRSDRPRNAAARLEKSQQNVELAKNDNVGVGTIREIITEVDSFPLPPPGVVPGIASRLLDVSLEDTTDSKYADKVMTETTTEKESLENNQTQSYEITKQMSLYNINDHKQLINASNQNLQKNETTSEASTPLKEDTVLYSETTTQQTESQSLKTSSLENILFSHVQTSTPAAVDVNDQTRFSTEALTESVSYNYSAATSADDHDFFQTTASNASTSSNKLEAISKEEGVSSVKEVSDEEDIHSSIVNHSQYSNPEPHYHTIEKEHNVTSKDPFELHALEGHGFHQLSNGTDTVTKVPHLSSLSASAFSTAISSADQNASQTPSGAVDIFPTPNILAIVPKQDESSILIASKDSNASNVSNFEEVWSEEEGLANTTTEDTSQQGKVVPQLQSDLLSNDIGYEESGDDENEHVKDEILRHMTTLRPQQNGSFFIQPCPVGLVACNMSGEGCGVRCDLRRDCPDNEDEVDCKCSDLLRAMGQSQKVCDGVDDCSDGSDEAECPWCPPTEYFRCPGSRLCITLERVCDGSDDCPGAQDEKRCVSLANSSEEAGSTEYRPQGYLVVRRNGRWGKLCLDTLSQSPDLDRRTRELGRAVCSALTYRNISSSIRTRDETEEEDFYYQISADTVGNRSSASSMFEPSSCEGREVLSVHCNSLECGHRPSATPSQRRRIVGGKSADSAGAWPWAVALYREGDFQCGGALIGNQWLVSAAHCFYSSLGAYWTARLGVLRRGSELPSGSEQVRRIRDIILHPQYEDSGFINDIALLKMDREVPFSDSLRPICLPSSPGEDASLWHGRRCSVVGWGKLYEIGHTFPDSLQEVRLPVISSAECQRKSIFLPAYRITPNMFCAGYERGGRDACLGDSGGPMACQRPADGRWVLLGVTSNGDGCGRPNRPGVYTQVAGYLTWIQEILQQKVFGGRPGSESACSGGIRCRLGRCIPRARMCDGKRDCASGEDEDSC